VAVDDRIVHRACGGAVDYALDAGKLEAGPHLVDVIATNARGQQSRRRLELYAGAYYLTQLATRFSDGGTVVSLRDVAPPAAAGQVVLRVFATREEGGRTVRAAEVHREARPSVQGPLSFFWKGAGAPGRFIAEVAFVDPSEKTVQAVEAPFVHDTIEAQHAAFGEIEGALGVNGDAAANTHVELVDERGRVVQTVVTTSTGNYRFRNVDGGKYKVRAEKQGFKPVESEVNAAPAAPAAKVRIMTF
jgi:squalene-hopene/tetraprenyl-beta-curcumene cyclase